MGSCLARSERARECLTIGITVQMELRFFIIKMYSTIYNKDKAKRLPHSTFDVERSMFDVQIVASEITTKLSYHGEIMYTGQEF
jgi:hypothetical protein